MSAEDARHFGPGSSLGNTLRCKARGKPDGTPSHILTCVRNTPWRLLAFVLPWPPHDLNQAPIRSFSSLVFPGCQENSSREAASLSFEGAINVEPASGDTTPSGGRTGCRRGPAGRRKRMIASRPSKCGADRIDRRRKRRNEGGSRNVPEEQSPACQTVVAHGREGKRRGGILLKGRPKAQPGGELSQQSSFPNRLTSSQKVASVIKDSQE
jgi:hypothetical protein